MKDKNQTKEKKPFNYTEAEKQTQPMPGEIDPNTSACATKISIAMQKAKHRFSTERKN